MPRQLALTLFPLLILAGIAACGGSDVATPTASPTLAPDSIVTQRPNLRSTPIAKPSPIPAGTPLANQTPASKTTETANGQIMQESNSPRPGDEVFDFCQSHYGNYHYNSPEVLLIDWTIDAYVRWSPNGSQVLFSGTPPGKPDVQLPSIALTLTANRCTRSWRFLISRVRGTTLAKPPTTSI